MATLLQLSTSANCVPLKPEAWMSLLDRTSDMKGLRQIHGSMIKTGLVLETLPASRLLAALCSSSDAGSLHHALLVFERIQDPNSFTWNTMIRALSCCSNPEQAVLLYSRMLYFSDAAAWLNPYTFPFLLKACASSPSALEEARQLHCHIVKNGFISDVYTANSLLHAYAKLGCVDSARLLFDTASSRDAVTWNSMISAYAKSGRLDMARRLFDLTETKNVISWTSMITGYVESCRFREALELFREMQALQHEADAVALTSALMACASLGALDQGRWIHAYVETKRVQIDSILGCVLVDMYAKCGEIDEARTVFRKIRRKNVSVWTAMITGFAVHGLGREALDTFADMEAAGVKPNRITFTSVLTACSYAGMVEEGRTLFERITEDYKMSPSIEHYGCMVDLLGRAGMIEEAEDLIKTMPLEPNVAVWGALLNACQIHRNFEVGKRAGKILVELEPDHSGRYIQLASILAAEGGWQEAMAVRKQMKGRGVLKLPGCSSISLNGRVHEFAVGDRLHPLCKEIYLQWELMLVRLKKEGYVPMTNNLMLDLEEEEKETVIQWHSEKLAMAFAFISTEPGTTIQIVKNLRICSDCHAVTKLISKVYGRKIVMRDRARFHVFENGNCSCRDYW